jgi:beta-lactamase regulating signal transducer with metallopeptidase domain
MNEAWPALVNGALLSVLPAAAVWVALRLTPRRWLNAATRYAVWWMVLAIVIALPAFYPRARNSREPLTAPRAEGVAAAAAAPRLPAGSPPGARLAEWRPIEIHRGWWWRMLPIVWMMGSLLLLVRLTVSYMALCRKSGRAIDAPERLQASAGRWLALVGAGGREARLAISAEIAIPVATGPRRPSILIPARLFEELSDDDVEQIGLHEAAHLARRDDYALMAQRVLEAALALHPVVRWITRQIDLEREIACDDLAVEATGCPQHYAACLTRAFALCGGVRASFAGANAADDRSHLSRRVELLVERTRRTGARLHSGRVAAFAAALAALACLAGRAPALVEFGGPRTAIAAAALPKMQKVEETKMNGRTIAMTMTAVAAVASGPVVARQETKPAAVEQAAPQVAPPELRYQDRQLVVLYLDLTALSQEDLPRAVSAAKKFLNSRRDGRQLVALISYDGRAVRVGHDFTGDFDLLERTLDQVQASGGDAATADDMRQIAALQTAVKMLGTLTGKKAVVYFAAPFAHTPDGTGQLEATIKAAIEANVAFYPIDVRGLPAGEGK